MDGTPGFLNLDIEVKECQSETTVVECRSKKYLELGKEICKCVPHYLRSFHMSVSFHTFMANTKKVQTTASKVKSGICWSSTETCEECSDFFTTSTESHIG